MVVIFNILCFRLGTTLWYLEYWLYCLRTLSGLHSVSNSWQQRTSRYDGEDSRTPSHFVRFILCFLSSRYKHCPTLPGWSDEPRQNTSKVVGYFGMNTAQRENMYGRTVSLSRLKYWYPDLTESLNSIFTELSAKWCRRPRESIQLDQGNAELWTKRQN